MPGPTEIRLDDALTQIVDHAHQVATVAAVDGGGGLLDGLKAVVKGERSRVRPDPPYLWVAVGAATATHKRALHETWEAALLLSAFVRSEQPEEGWMEAFQWAARARSVVLADRSPAGLPFVEDIQSAELGPLGQFAPSRKFGAFARVTVRFALVEPTGA